MILYEYPFNERTRTMLRLEHLFSRMRELIPRDHPLDHHFAIVTLFEVMDVAARADLKSDMLKDLDRQRQQLSAYRGNPSISEKVLDEVIAHIDQTFTALNNQPGKAGQSLTDNEWLMAIRSRASIPAGTCEFDLPAYYAWQHLDANRRRTDLHRWAATLAPLAAAVELLLQLMRDSGVPQKVMATGGSYQQSLPAHRSYHLLRLRMDPVAELVPEISGHRLIVAIRLMQASADGRLKATTADAPLEITLCG